MSARSLAKRLASSPPSAPRISTMTSLPSKGSVGRRRSRSSSSILATLASAASTSALASSRSSPAAGVHELLPAGVEGVADVAQLDVQVGLRRAGGERVPARAPDRRLDVLRMDVGLHGYSSVGVRRRRPGGRSAGRIGSLGDVGQELLVALRRLDLVHQQLEPGGGAALVAEGVEHPPELPHLLELRPVEQQLLVPGGAGVDVDGGVDPALRQLAIETELHVARALELLEDHLVHA